MKLKIDMRRKMEESKIIKRYFVVETQYGRLSNSRLRYFKADGYETRKQAVEDIMQFVKTTKEYYMLYIVEGFYLNLKGTTDVEEMIKIHNNKRWKLIKRQNDIDRIKRQDDIDRKIEFYKRLEACNNKGFVNRLVKLIFK
jgi:hypothetical protein